MRMRKTAIVGIIGSSLVWLAACQQPQEEAPAKPQLSAKQQCYDACTKTVDATRTTCREKLMEEGALDRMMDCNIAADKETETCRASCDETTGAE